MKIECSQMLALIYRIKRPFESVWKTHGCRKFRGKPMWTLGHPSNTTHNHIDEKV